jgi:hypothetical protein
MRHVAEWTLIRPELAALGESGDLVKSLGGTATGLVRTAQLASRSKLPVTIPSSWLFVDSEGIGQPCDTSSIAKVPTGSASGWAIKYTGLQESFSCGARRGRDSSSARRVPAGASTQRMAELVQTAWDNRPHGTIGIVLQEMVPLIDPLVLHVDADSSETWVELIDQGSRELRRYDRSTVVEVVEVTGSGTTLDSTSWHSVESLLVELRSMNVELPIPLNIEALMCRTDKTIWLLQLRPTPDDRPNSLGSSQSSARAAYSTHFVWGAFDEVVDLSAAPGHSSGFQVRTTADRAEWEQSESSAQPIRIDCVEGFRLTHEPWNLPDPRNRDGFKYLHIPLATYASLASRGSVRIVSDGNQAHVYETSSRRGSPCESP